MKEQSKYKNDERIEQIYALLVQYTVADFSGRIPVSDNGDELDAIIVGLNTLGEELQASGKAVKKFNERINSLMEVLLKYTVMDFSAKAEITSEGDELDAIAVGLNTLAEELQAAKEAEELHAKELEEKAEEVSRLNKKMERNLEELEIANKELEAFTYSVSHDLRSPLRAIHGYTKIIAADYGDKIDGEGKELMEGVMRNAIRMGQLIDDLLAFSRTGKKELVKQDIDMTNLANAVVEEVRVSTGNRKGKIEVQELPPSYADHSLLTLVFTNLINNALKYSSTKENPEITIGSMKKNNETIYYIKDNGVGFDMQYYNKLFGVFQRLHSAQEFEGTGVGLALIKRIILRHGGRIWAEGKKGEGAIFYFTLN
ncbi:MAG: hypothetical protein K0Q95_2355 [Bacteroidota bacterium]|nr:hypothetical protein [Bacteroidota bacterium]